ncbi:MAG: TolC family protein, partial [Deltaproteobacteria bacterium]|nr:TolC family protein [Deltaproteobacteria bacterium]
ARGHEGARATVQRQREQLARDVAGVLIDVLRTRRLVELAKTSTTRAQAQLDHATSRVKAGNALRNVELQARLDFKRAEQQTVVAARDANFAETAFMRVVGRAAPPKLELPQEPVLPTKEEAIDLAKRRADVAALQLRLQEAQKLETAAGDRRWFPRADVEATVQYFAPRIIATRNIEWNVLARITIPLLEPGQHTAFSFASSETRIASLQFQQQLKVVVEEVELAAFQLASAIEAARLSNEQVEAARELYKLVDRQFRLGAITFLEVANAQAVLVEAENAFEITRMDRVLAIYDYLFVIGALEVSSGAPVVGKTTAAP